jgi:hypothetical protein
MMVLLGGLTGFWPAFLALVLYSVLPILANTVIGIRGIDPALTEAARGQGMDDRQMLWRVELPLAAPVIIGGVRTATVLVVGTAMAVIPILPIGPDNLVAPGRVDPIFAAYFQDLAGAKKSLRPKPDQIRRFDARPDRFLREIITNHPVALERERALWEYADRMRSDSVPLLQVVARRDTEPVVRCSALWVIRKVAAIGTAEAITPSLNDDHPEVRDWAALFLRELHATHIGPGEKRGLRFDATNPFDQTMPLVVAGYAQVLIPGLGCFRATLSPLWFESIMGRMMACTRADAFKTGLILEKRLARYHPDGSHHYQIFRFRGFTRDLGPGVCHHRYEALARHTFYPSGKIEDTSQPALDDVVVFLRRSATTIRVPFPHDPSRTVVSSVRGRLMGAAFVNVQRILSQGMQIGPGEVQVVNYDHPVLRSLTNTFLFCTFRGKLSDLDGDGYLDVNTERCHSTVSGELDQDLDGIPDYDPYDPCCR